MMIAPFLRAALPQPDADALFRAMLRFAGSPLSLSDNGTLRFSEAPSCRPGDLFCLNTGEGRQLFFQWLDFPMQAVTGIALAPEACANLPAPLRLALCRGMLTHFLNLLPGSGLLASGVDPQSAVLAGPVPEGLRFLEITASFEGTGPFSFLLGATTADLVSEFRPPIDADPERGFARQVPVPFDVRIAALVLMQSDIARLETGDLLVLPKDLPPPALCGLGQIVDLEPSENGQSRIKAGSPQGADEVDRAVPSGWARLDIMAGQHHASLGDIEDWREKSPVALSFPVPDEGMTASLYLWQTLVGRGEFLRLDGRIALRITSLAAKTETTGLGEP